MAAPTSLDIYNACQTAILSVISGGKKSATFQGRSYTLQDLPDLQKMSEVYRRKAIQDGLLVATTANSPVGVSSVWVTDPFLYQ